MASFMLVGEDIGPTNDAERIYTTAVLILGQIITAVVIGNIGIVLNNQQSLTALYQNYIDRVNVSMATLNLPDELQGKVREYYEYLWLRHRVFQPTELTFRHDLNKSIRAEVELFLNARLVSSNPLFEELSEAVVLDIVIRFQTTVFLSGDYIIRHGEWGDSMFFIAAGIACAKIKDQIVAEYGRGDSFGEKCFATNGGLRNADIRALSKVDARELTREAFNELQKMYPEISTKVLRSNVSDEFRSRNKHLVKSNAALKIAQERDEMEEGVKLGANGEQVGTMDFADLKQQQQATERAGVGSSPSLPVTQMASTGTVARSLGLGASPVVEARTLAPPSVLETETLRPVSSPNVEMRSFAASGHWDRQTTPGLGEIVHKHQQPLLSATQKDTRSPWMNQEQQRPAPKVSLRNPSPREDVDTILTSCRELSGVKDFGASCAKLRAAIRGKAVGEPGTGALMVELSKTILLQVAESVDRDVLGEYHMKVSEAANLINRVQKSLGPMPGPKAAPLLFRGSLANCLAGNDDVALKLLRNLRNFPAQEGDNIDEAYSPREMYLLFAVVLKRLGRWSSCIKALAKVLKNPPRPYRSWHIDVMLSIVYLKVCAVSRSFSTLTEY